MIKSETITKIIPALLRAQKNMGAASKGASNPYFKSKYADLNAVLEVCKDPLNAEGIFISQPPAYELNGKQIVETILFHESGEFLGGAMVLELSKLTMQDVGSGVSYARRYTLQSLLAIPSEDDDGEKTMKRGEKTSVAKKVEETVEKALHAAVAKVDPNTGDIEIAAKEFTKQIAPVVKSSFKKSTPAAKADEWEN